MTLANLCDLGRGVTIAGSDFAQTFPGHAVEAVNGLAVIAGRDQQFMEGRPIIAPIEIETNALAQFVLVDFAAPPLVEDVLIAGEDGFNAKYDRAVSGQGTLLEERRGIALGAGQRVVVADQNHVGGMQSILHLLGVKQRIVAAEGLAELAQVFAAAWRILGAD